MSASQPQPVRNWFGQYPESIMSSLQLNTPSGDSLKQPPVGVAPSLSESHVSPPTQTPTPAPSGGLSMEDLFAVYSSMAEHHQFIPEQSTASFKASGGSTVPLHVDILVHQQQRQQSADALASRLANITLQSPQALPPQPSSIFAPPDLGTHSPASPFNPLAGMSGGFSGAVPPAPGLQRQGSRVSPQPHAQLLDPSQIKWYYLDPQGAQQGPFDGMMMQQWYSQDYLVPELRVRREGQASYTTMADFLSFIGEFQYPFTIPLPAVSMPVAPPVAPPLQPQMQQPPLSQQPFAAGSASSLLGSAGGSAFFGNSAGAGFLGTDLYGNFLPDTGSANLRSSIFAHGEPVKSVEPEPQVQKHKEVSPMTEEPKDVVEEQKIEEPKVVEKPKEEIKEPQVKPAKAKPGKSVKEPKHHVQPHVVKGSEKPKKGSETVIAPWASVSSQPKAPAKSLIEIQMEEERKELERKKQDEQVQYIAAEDDEDFDVPADGDLSSYILKNTDSTASLPTTSTWGSSPWGAAASPKKQKPAKTLEEIRHEEAQKAAAKERVEAAARKQKSIAASIAAQKERFASSINSEGGSWTLVTNKKLPKKDAVKETHKRPQAALSPSALRTVSASTRSPSQTSVLSGSSWNVVGSKSRASSSVKSSQSTSPKIAAPASFASGDYSDAKQFLAWCRGQLQRLYSTVNKEDVLSIMLQLPAGSESTEIVADTIYSNSSTMDGRRFASEFNKRRQKVEEHVVRQGYDFNWQELLKSGSGSTSAQDDVWDSAFTKVTSKRNRRRN